MNNMRKLMVDELKQYNWLDKKYESFGDGGDYKEWLESLSDEDLLATYNRVVVAVTRMGLIQ